MLLATSTVREISKRRGKPYEKKRLELLTKIKMTKIRHKKYEKEKKNVDACMQN